jgi:hypothetical protein
MSDWTSALWSVAGYALALLIFAAFTVAVLFLLRITVFRRGRTRPAGWAPWWYVGGQPDVPKELLEEPTGRSRKGRNR